MAITTHDATSWNVYRATLDEHAHDVDQVRYIGGKGTRLDALLERSYTEEARQLAADLMECLSSLPEDVARSTLADMKGPLEAAAGGRHSVARLVPDDVIIPDPPKRERKAVPFLDEHREEGVGDITGVDLAAVDELPGG
jgi:hypothetical protein